MCFILKVPGTRASGCEGVRCGPNRICQLNPDSEGVFCGPLDGLDPGGGEVNGGLHLCFSIAATSLMLLVAGVA